MKIKTYVHAHYDHYDKKYDFVLAPCDMSDFGSYGPLVGETEIDFDPPPHEVLVAGTIQQYRDEQKKILAEAEAKRATLEQRINELLCIDYTPEVATGTTE